MANKTWSEKELRHCLRLLKQGKTDNEVVPLMRAKFRQRHWNVNMIRSHRGRLERTGTLQYGVAGSSTLVEEIVPKPKREYWTPAAEQRLAELYHDGKDAGAIAKTLKLEVLRKSNSPSAVKDRIYKLNREGRLREPMKQTYLPFTPETAAPKVHAPVQATNGHKKVTISTETGEMTFERLSPAAFKKVLDVCVQDQMGLSS